MDLSSIIVLLVIAGQLHGFDLSSSLESFLPEPSLKTAEAADLSDFFVDQVQDMRLDLTRSFIAQHSRRKREILKYSYEASLASKSEGGFETRGQSISYPCMYKNQTLILQEDGIYSLADIKRPSTLAKVTSWTLDRGERILKTAEWTGTLFILTANGQKTRLYTLTHHGGTSYSVGMKQEMRSEAYPTAATFFVHAYDLYLILTMDNKAHSLTISPIYRWSRTYMDQIHEIQTRGAVDVVAFPVSSYTYVAIAQAEDAAGNQEVGTLIIRMYAKGEVEKVQLLWSIHAVSVTYVRFLEEHFLVIGQRDEASICYWFGGYHFVYWQSLPGLLGNSVFLDSFVLPDHEPLLLGSTESTVGIYARRKIGTATEISSLNLTSVLYRTTSSSERIVDARFIQSSAIGEQTLSLALTLQISQVRTSFQILPLILTKVAITEAQVDSEDKLSSCMNSLRRALDEDEESLGVIERADSQILTKSGDWTFDGRLVTKVTAEVGPKSTVSKMVVAPQVKSEDGYNLPPSVLARKSEQHLEDYKNFMEKILANILTKSKSGQISAHFKFPNELRIRTLQSASGIKLDALNGIPWEILESQVLHRDLPNQVVTGNWEIYTLKSTAIETGSRIGNAYISDFLLTTHGRRTEVQGNVTFARDLDVEDLVMGPYVTLNGIPFGDIALKSEGDTVIRGYKTGESVKGGTKLEVDLVNQVKLLSWYENTLKIDGIPQESCTGNKTFLGDVTIKALTLDRLNGRDWNEFAASVLLNGVDQDVHGDLTTGKLKVTDLYVQKINSVPVDDWMTTSTSQTIRSNIHVVSQAQFRKNVNSNSINEIQLSDGVLRSDTDVTISGPLEFSSLTLGNLTFNSRTTLNSLQISAAAQLRKKHIYSTVTGEELALDGNVEVGELESSRFNGMRFGSIRDYYWSREGNNRISSDFQFGSAKISADVFSTSTLNSIGIEDFVRLSSDGPITGNLQFNSDVVVSQPVVMADGTSINTYDISEVERDIVRISDSQRRIGGRKEFTDLIEARGGIEVNEINGIYVKKDLVFLEGYGKLGNKNFEEVVAEEVQSEVDVKVSGLVNGVELKSIGEKSVYLDSYEEKLRIESDVVFHKSLSVDSLTVLNGINGIKVAEILANVIPLDEEVMLERSLVISEGKVRFLSPSETESINGISPKDWLSKIVSRSEDADFLGSYEFSNVVVDGMLSCDWLNNVNLTNLEASAFSKTKHQLIPGQFTFQEVYSQGNLITTNLSGIPISEFVRIDEDSKIFGDIVFKTDTLAVQNNIQLRGLLNNYKIEEVAEYLKGLEGHRKFGKITVEGNLSWDVSEVSRRRLSYLLSNAVTVNTDQHVRGLVTFANDLDVNTLQTLKWIKGVDLAFILKDCLFPYDEALFTGHVVFDKEIVAGGNTYSSRGRSPVQVKGHLNTAKVNDIVLKTLYQEIVRRNSSRKVYGTKTFSRGISVYNLNVYGLVDGIDTKTLVTFGDDRQVDTVTMSDVSISGNLHFKKLNGYDLEYFFPERITVEKNHRIDAPWIFQEDVKVKNCEFYSINDLRLSNIFFRKSLETQRFSGEKKFHSVTIEGDLEDVTINGIALDKVKKGVLGLDRDEVIHRHMLFLDTVHLAGPLNITGAVNDYSIDAVAQKFTANLEDLVENMLVSEETRKHTSDLIYDLQKAQNAEQGFWLDYVEDRVELAGILEGPTTRVESFVHPDEDGKVTIAFHGQTTETGGALPTGCTCSFLQFFHFDKHLEVLDNVRCLRIFDVVGNDVSYTIYSHVVSYNKTCSRREKGETFVSVSQNERERYRIKDRGSVKADWSVGRLEGSGFISDVKAFVVGKKSYLVIAQSFDAYAGTHRAEVLVFETTYDRLEKVQSLESHGARRLALDDVNGNWILIIGNEGERDDADQGEKCPTKSTIYQWSPGSRKFVLVREVPTTGLVDVSLLSIDIEGYFSEAFAAFAQNEDETFGKVAIYKYKKNDDLDTFSFYQEIETEGPVGGIESFSIGGSSYLILAVPSTGLKFYQYTNLEGFKLKLTVTGVKKASDVGFVIRKGEIFFPVASSDPTVEGMLTQGIFQGRLN